MLTSTVSGVRCLSVDADPGGSGHLGAAIARALTSRRGVREDRELDARRRLLTTGDVLPLAQQADVVWGSALSGPHDARALPSAIDVRSVRGPLTRAVLLSRGIAVPDVFGDPGLLIDEVFPEIAALPRGGGGTVVDPSGPIDDVLRAVASADLVVASDLFALIAADALGVPSRPMAGIDPFAFLDYYAGTGRPGTVPADSLDAAIALGPVEPAEIDRERLRAAFPWDLWGIDRSPMPNTSALPSSYLGLRLQASTQRDEVVGSLGDGPTGIAASAIVRLDQMVAAPMPSDGITREEIVTLGIDAPHLVDDAPHEVGSGVRLSVVVPTHNVAPWVRETLQSILTQDVDAMEVIVVDDHSTDATPQIVGEIAASDARVTLVNAISRGGGTARNIGLDHARGTYVAFADGDDIVPVGAYASLVGSLDRTGSEIAVGDYLKFSPDRTWRPTNAMPAFDRGQEATALAAEPTLLYSRPCWNKVFSREWWEARAIRFPDAPRSNDIAPMVSAYLLARSIDIVEDVAYLYRQRPGGTSMTSQADNVSSVVSYLTQERLCAQLIAAAHNPALDSVYATLVYDRDTYAHIKRYLASGTERAGGERIVTALRRLLAVTPEPPDYVSPRRRLVLELTALGEFSAAAALAADAPTTNESARAQFAGWRLAIEAIEANGLLRSRDAEALLAPLSAVLTSVAAGTEPESWLLLVETARRLWGERAVMLVPEARLPADRTAEALALRQLADASVRVVSGGRRTLVLEGRSSLGERTVEPVLHDGEFPGQEPVLPTRVRWVQESADSWRWRAVFPVDAVPLHRPVTPGLLARERGLVVSSRSRGPLPLYTVSDAFLYDGSEDVLVVRRRRHWAPRAARRAAIIVSERAGIRRR